MAAMPSSDASQLAYAPERRLAYDGRPYTRREFLEWYGCAGERKWADAVQELADAPQLAHGRTDGVAEPDASDSLTAGTSARDAAGLPAGWADVFAVTAQPSLEDVNARRKKESSPAANAAHASSSAAQTSTDARVSLRRTEGSQATVDQHLKRDQTPPESKDLHGANCAKCGMPNIAVSQTVKVLKDNAIDNERVISMLREMSMLREQIHIVIAQCSELERGRDLLREKADEATQAADVANADLQRAYRDSNSLERFYRERQEEHGKEYQLLPGRIRKLERDNEASRNQLGRL